MVDQSPIILIYSTSVPAQMEDNGCQLCITHRLYTFPVTLVQDRKQLSCLRPLAFAVAFSLPRPPVGPAVNNVTVRSSARLQAPSRPACKKSWQQPSLLQPVAFQGSLESVIHPHQRHMLAFLSRRTIPVSPTYQGMSSWQVGAAVRLRGLQLVCGAWNP